MEIVWIRNWFLECIFESFYYEMNSYKFTKVVFSKPKINP